MKAIFLDFDGVINDIHNKSIKANASFIEELKKVTNVTEAKVIVTSSHKNEFLGNSNIKMEDTECYNFFLKPLIQAKIEIYGYTPTLDSNLENGREAEILYYLKQHPEIEEFVIIEDDYVMNKLYNHQVFIEYSDGFSSQYVEPTVEILNGNLGFYPPEYDRNETFQERVHRLFPYVILDDVIKDESVEKFLKKLSR